MHPRIISNTMSSRIDLLLVWEAGSAGYSIAVYNWLLSHIEPNSLRCLLTRTSRNLLNDLPEALGCGLSTSKNRKSNNLVHEM